MNSETNSLGYENNIQTIPESHSFPENKYKHEIPIIYHSESDKIIDQSCEARLLNDTPNKNHAHIKYLLYENASRSI
ncbi:hypothetical protein NUBL21980_09170 [Klebsiella michiganensis]|nr:hypothetical protein NUBL21980_09170 [Klebsiella michiganensis]